MFTYFHDKKLKYNKGQLAPFFIVILVAIIMMALVTVNLSKVALTRTETSNAVDAGSIAAGAVMANVFNSIAFQNGQMEFSFWSSWSGITGQFVIAIGSLAFALGTGCTPLACAGLSAAGVAYWTVWSIIASVSMLKLLQYYLYSIIKSRIAIPGRESAVKAGHLFVFFNSVIGQKLKEGAQRDNFKNFMDNGVNHDQSYPYSWQDGQGRSHSVTSTVTIEPVNRFMMQTTLIPFPAIIVFLIDATFPISFSMVPGFGLSMACAASACCPASPPCCADIIVGCMEAMPFLIAALAELAVVWAGLWPAGLIVEDDGDGNILDAALSPWIYAWIDDIDHDHLVTVQSTQTHAGADLGLWTTEYPNTTSYSVVNFANGDRGRIHPPSSHYSSDIVRTDSIGGGS